MRVFKGLNINWYYKSLALQDFIILMVGKTGFEPATSWSQTKRSTKLSYFPKIKKMVENKGFEPLTPCVQGKCSSQLS